MEEIQLGQETNKNNPLGLIILILLGVFFIYLIGQRTQLTCTRASNAEIDCLIESVWMGSVTVSSREASGVRNAYVDESYDDEDDSYAYRVVLRTTSGDVPVTRAYSSGNTQKREVAEEVNTFIKDQSRTEMVLDFKGAGSIISAVILGIFLLAGIAGVIALYRKKAVSPDLMGSNGN
jgi:hypothetical protein